MNKLIRTTQSLILSGTDKVILKARESKKIKDCSTREIKEALAYLLTLLGEVKFMEQNKGTAVISVLIDSLYKGFPQLRIEELKTAFDLAINGKFEINLSLYNRVFNSEFISKVINTYKEFRKKTLVKELKLIEEKVVEKTDKQKAKIVKEGIAEEFEKYKDTGIMPKSCAWMYVELEKSSAINHSNEFKKEIKEGPAMEELKRRLEIEKLNTDGRIGGVITRLNNLDKDPDLAIVAREIALKHYWDEIINKSK